MMRLAWELNGDTPIYLQLVERLRQTIITGQYLPGDKLPSVRELASIAAVNPNTMQKALSELERLGLVYSNRTSGRFVTEDLNVITHSKHSIAEEEISRFLSRMSAIGYEPQESLEQINYYVKERQL